MLKGKNGEFNQISYQNDYIKEITYFPQQTNSSYCFIATNS